jgi:tetratricopeptide (TPR) repeat protein
MEVDVQHGMVFLPPTSDFPPDPEPLEREELNSTYLELRNCYSSLMRSRAQHRRLANKAKDETALLKKRITALASRDLPQRKELYELLEIVTAIAGDIEDAGDDLVNGFSRYKKGRHTFQGGGSLGDLMRAVIHFINRWGRTKDRLGDLKQKQQELINKSGSSPATATPQRQWQRPRPRPDAVQPTIESVAAFHKLTASSSSFKIDLADALAILGFHSMESGRTSEALSPTMEAAAIYRRITPSNPKLEGDLALSLDNLSGHYAQQGRTAEALALTTEAVAIFRRLVASNPRLRGDLARALYNLGVHHSALGHPSDALPPTFEAVAIYRSLADSDPALQASRTRSGGEMAHLELQPC